MPIDLTKVMRHVEGYGADAVYPNHKFMAGGHDRELHPHCELCWLFNCRPATVQEIANYLKRMAAMAEAEVPSEVKPRINLEPMRGKVVVRPDDSEKLISGLYVIRNQKQSVGQLVAVYKGFHDPATDEDVEPFLQEGDWVIFGQHSGVEVTLGRSDKYIILKESEILARITDPDSLDKQGVKAL